MKHQPFTKGICSYCHLGKLQSLHIAIIKVENCYGINGKDVHVHYMFTRQKEKLADPWEFLFHPHPYPFAFLFYHTLTSQCFELVPPSNSLIPPMYVFSKKHTCTLIRTWEDQSPPSFSFSRILIEIARYRTQASNFLDCLGSI